MKKGAQAWGLDLMVAITIFLAGIILFFFYALNFSSERVEVFDALSYEGKIIGDSLFSEGFPNDWNETNVVSIGILSNGQVNNTKLKRFYDLANTSVGYAKTKNLFNVLDNYYVYFEDPIVIDGVTINGIGIPESGQKNLARITRVMVQDGQIKNLNINVWS